MSQSPASPPFAAIFDWDGVIIDSAPLHERSWHRLAQEIGKSVAPGSFRRGFGMRNEQIIPEIHAWSADRSEINQLSDRKEELYRDLVRDSGIQPLPGVTAWIECLKQAGVPRVVASSTHRANIDLILEAMGLADAFDAIVSAEDVILGKPDPEVFLEAAARVKMPPSKSVVFEDAHVGIRAARAAGMQVIAVATTHLAGELAQADLVVARLDELSIKQMLDLVSAGAPHARL